MSMPSVHSCFYLTEENNKLTSKYKKLTTKYKVLEKELLEIKEKYMQLQFSMEYGQKNSLKDEPAIPVSKLKNKKIANADEQDAAMKKHMVAHKKLLRRIEEQTKKSSMIMQQNIALKTDNDRLKDDMSKKDDQIADLQRKLEKQLNIRNTPQSNVKKIAKLKENLSVMREEKYKVTIENAKLKNELAGLDHSFFEEIEDLKYALHQSSKLNKQYEKALKKVCSQFGLDYDGQYGQKSSTPIVQDSFKDRSHRPKT